MNVRRFLLLILVVVSQVSSAGDIPIEKVPKLFQLHAFQSESDPNHYLILGKDGIYADAGNWYVLNWQNGSITSPELKHNSYFYFGGGFDFHFESGQWLYIPGGNSGQGAPGATLEVIPPGLIDPNRGREPFRSVPVDEPLIKQLGLSNLVSPDFNKELQAIATRKEPPKRVAPNDDIVLFAVEFNRKDDDQRDLARALRDRLSENAEGVIDANELYGNKGQSTLYVWAFERQAKAVEGFIQEQLHKSPRSFRQALEPNSSALPIGAMNAFYDMETMERLKNAAATFDLLEGKSPSDLRTQNADKVAWDIANIIQAVEFSKQLMSRADYNLRFFENGEAAKKKIAQRFTEPVEQLLSRGYAILDKMQTPFARKILLLSGEDRVSRLSFLDRPSGVGSETYFQTWLSLLKNRIMWVQLASEKEREGMRGGTRSGGILSEFGFMNVEVRDHTPSKPEPPYLDDIRNPFPLLVFGLKDSTGYRADLARFIIEMDKAAEYQRTRFTTKYDGKIVGSRTLADVLNALSYAPGYRDSTSHVPGFSRPLYYIQVMKVVSELLNTSRFTITNSATYLHLLNTAISLQKAVTNEFGKVPNADSKSAELNALTEELLNLHQAVQVRMVRGVFHDPHGRPENCAGALSAL